MQIKGTGDAKLYRASVLSLRYGITAEQGKALKLGEIVDVEPEIAQKIIVAGLATQVKSEPVDDNVEVEE